MQRPYIFVERKSCFDGNRYVCLFMSFLLRYAKAKLHFQVPLSGNLFGDARGISVLPFCESNVMPTARHSWQLGNEFHAKYCPKLDWLWCFRFLGEVNASTFGYPRSRFERCTSAGQDSHMHSFIQLKEARSLATLCLPENLTIHAHLGMKQCQKFDCDFICRETCAHKVQIRVRKTKAQHTRVGW